MNSTPLHPKALTKLPDMAVYGPGVAGSVKRKTLVTVPPIQGSDFKPDGQRVIQIFLPKNGFLNGVNSYLTFYHRTPGSGYSSDRPFEANALSTSASNWIQRLRIKVGGRIVEDIDDYNVLHEIIKTSVVTAPFRDSLAGQAEGLEPSFVPKAFEDMNVTVASTKPDTRPQYLTSGAAAWSTATENTFRTTASRDTIINVRGPKVNLNRSGSVNYASVTTGLIPSDAAHTLQHWGRMGKMYQIKILSGFLESRKYLPLRFMPPVEIELTLSDFARSHVWAPARQANAEDVDKSYLRFSNSDELDGFVRGYDKNGNNSGNGVAQSETASADKSYVISNVNYMCEMLEFDETFYQAFEMSLAQGVTIPYTTFTSHTFAYSGKSADIQVAERVRSAKALFAVMRKNNDLAYPAYSKFMFTQNNLTEYQVKIGTQYFPMQPIQCGKNYATTWGITAPENAYSDGYSTMRLLELTKCISAMADTTHAMTVDVRDHMDKFIIGIDLDREFNRLSGLDTTKGLPLYLSLKAESGSECQLSVFVHYDMFVDLFPGEVIEVLN